MLKGLSVSFVSFVSLTSQLFRSFVCACRSRVSHRYTRLALRAMLAPLTLIHSLIHFTLPFIHACLSLTRQSPLHSPDTIVSCSLRLHSFTSSFHSFVSLLRLLTHSTHFTSVTFHMLLAYARFLCWLSPRLEQHPNIGDK